MRPLPIILLISASLLSCKNNSESSKAVEARQEADDLREISGNFTYFDEVAVFQTQSELFGVVENEKFQELIAMTIPLKEEDTDEVAVVLKVKTVKKPELEDGWEHKINIIDIINVSKVEQQLKDIINIKTE